MTSKYFFLVAIFICSLVITTISCNNEKDKQKGNIVLNDTLTIPESPAAIEYSTSLYYNSLDSCAAGKAGCTYIRINYPVIENGPDKVTIDTLSKLILNLIQVYETSSATPDSIGRDFLEAYTSYKKTSAKRTTEYPAWYIEKSIAVNYSSPYYFCLTYEEDSYTGGAHGNNATNYYNYSLISGKEITLKDIIAEEKMDSLSMIGEQLFRLTKKIAPGKKLSSEGYFVFTPNDSLQGKFYLNENFSLGNNGLIFFYNAYEMAPYSSGSSKIVIPYSRLRRFAIPGSLLAEKLGI